MSDNLAIFQKNLEALSLNNPELAVLVQNLQEIKGTFEIKETRCGDTNIYYNNQPMHDEIDVIEEAQVILKNVPHKEKSAINVLFGLGLGYVFKLLARKLESKIILIEPNIEILRFTLEVVDLSEELSKKTIKVVHKLEEIQEAITGIYTERCNFSICFTGSYYKLYPDLIKQFQDEISYASGTIQIGFQTFFNQSERWTNCFLDNMSTLIKNKELESLRDKFKNKPAVIVSAGPSLDKAINLIKENENKFIIFCVGTSAKALYSNNIIPDFISVIESKDCYGQIHGLDLEKTNIITIPASNKLFHNTPAKRTFNYYPNNMLDTHWLGDEFIDFPINDYGNRGSVSFTAFFSAVVMGCNPIVLTGQDLAYVDGQCYSKNSCYKVSCDFDEESQSYKIAPESIEEYNKTNYVDDIPEHAYKEIEDRYQKTSEHIYFVDGQDGKRLPTDGGYATFIKYFEVTAQELDGRLNLINSSTGGANLKGFENIPFDKVVADYAKEDIPKEEIIEKSIGEYRNLIKDKGEFYYEKVSSLNTDLNNDLKLVEEGQHLVKKINMSLTRNKQLVPEINIYIDKVFENYFKVKELLRESPIFAALIIKHYKVLNNSVDKLPDEMSYEETIEFKELFKTFYNNIEVSVRNAQEKIKKAKEEVYESCIAKS